MTAYATFSTEHLTAAIRATQEEINYCNEHLADMESIAAAYADSWDDVTMRHYQRERASVAREIVGLETRKKAMLQERARRGTATQTTIVHLPHGDQYLLPGLEPVEGEPQQLSLF